VTPHTPEQIIAHGEEISMLSRTAHPLGDVLSVDEDTAVLLSYYRNNVLHLFTASAWIACASCTTGACRARVLHRLGRTCIRSCKSELFLPWDEDGFAERIDAPSRSSSAKACCTLVNEDEGGILARKRRPDRRGVPPARDRAFAAAGLRALLHRDLGAGEERPGHLVLRRAGEPVPTGRATPVAAVCAGRAGILRPHAVPQLHPEDARDAHGVAERSGKLVFDERLDAWAKDARIILGRELRHTIEKISPEAAKPKPMSMEVPLPPPEEMPPRRRKREVEPAVRPARRGSVRTRASRCSP
jgi:glycerol-3-phosphate O-acyltransferase